jgi:hypothetical protein
VASGGIAGIGAIDVAGQIGALGLDPMRFLYTTDGIERMIMIKVAERVSYHKNKMDENLATMIANKVGQLFSKR